MSFPRYPEVKVSGVEWLGEVPAHWEVTKLSYITSRIGSGKTPSGGATAYVSSGVPFIRSQNVHDQGLRLDDIVYIDEATDREMAWSRVRPLDVLINITGASIGRSCQVPAGFGRANVNQHVCVIRLDKAEETSGWVAWAMKAPSTKEQVKVSQTGAAREGLNFEQLASFYLCMPSPKERRTISAFLDHETARIDALVEEQQRLIELLKEKRQAVISHAVTKGLDPDVPMKDSGVEWLGEVPAHWEVAPLKYLATEKVAGPYGASLTKAMYTTSGYRVYGQQQVIPNDFSSGDYYISQEKFEEMIRYQVFPGDVLFSVMGTVGKVAVAPPEVEPGIINPRLVRYRFCRKVNPDFIRLLVMSQHYQRSLQESAQGSTMEGLNMSILGDLPVLLPDPEEQGDIVAWLTKESSLLEELVSQAKHAMELFNERRSALISAAVTGKIDVRGWRPPEVSSAHLEAVQMEGV